jgi:hypothetical protein
MSLSLTEQLTSQTVIVSLTLGKPGNSKKVKNSEIEVLPSDHDGERPDQDKLRVSKLLLDSPVLTEIGQRYAALRRWLDEQCLPTKFVRRGMGVLKANAIPTVTARFEAEKVIIERLVEQFRTEYPQKVTESFQQLGALANPLDYPSVEEICEQFEFEYNYLTFDTPHKVLGAISADLAKTEEAKLNRQMTQIVADIEVAFTMSFSQLVEGLKAGLSGKKKISEKYIDKCNTFFEKFMNKNLGTDERLTNVIEQARDLINGVSPEELNTQGTMREFIKAKMDEIKAEIDATIVDRGERYIRLPQQPVAVGATPTEEAHA